MDLSKKSTQINNSNTLEALDCISRKMASEGIARLARNKFSLDDSYGFYLNGLKDADYLVSHLPPVQSELEDKIRAIGYTGKEGRIYIGGRLFAVRELAQ